MKASERFVRILIRRPHAYEFRARHAAAPIPAIAFLDGRGELKGTFKLDAAASAAKLAGMLEELTK